MSNLEASGRRAVILDAHGGPEVMRIAEEPVPSLAAGSVLIATDAIGVNFGDTLIRRGEYYRDAPLSIRPGFEVVGRVVAAAPGVELRPGERVAAFVPDGGYASVVLASAHHVVRVPPDMRSVDAAALFVQGLTAWYAVHRYGMTKAGDRVLVHAGAGGVGGLAIQLVTLIGARAIATSSTPEKRQIALERGAEIALGSDPATLQDALREALGGRRLNVVLDAVGGPLFALGFRSLGLGGRYVVYGAASREESMLDARTLFPHNLQVLGFHLAAVFELYESEPARSFAELASLLASGELTIETTTFPFERVAEAHELIESRQLVGKIVLELES